MKRRHPNLDRKKFKARGGMTREQVKAAVRERDGHLCAGCGMTDDAHCEQFGGALEVHRKVPGSLYTVDGCVTLCKSCHGAEPKRNAGSTDLEYGPTRGFMVRLPDYLYEPLKQLTARTRRRLVMEVTIALERYLRSEGIPTTRPAK